MAGGSCPFDCAQGKLVSAQITGAMASRMPEPPAWRAQTALDAEFPDLHLLCAARGTLPFFYLEQSERDLAIVALGSAAEVTACLEVAVSLDSLAQADVADALELADRVRAITYRLARR